MLCLTSNFSGHEKKASCQVSGFTAEKSTKQSCGIANFCDCTNYTRIFDKMGNETLRLSTGERFGLKAAVMWDLWAGERLWAVLGER